MLKKKSFTNREECLYECDRCKVEMNTKNRNTIYVQEGTTEKHKVCDLCNRCYKALIRGIKGYSLKAKNTKNN